MHCRRDAQGLGLTVLRTWAFNDGAQWNSFQPTPGVLDERVLREVQLALTPIHGDFLCHAACSREG